jgi:hypothetical protein
MHVSIALGWRVCLSQGQQSQRPQFANHQTGALEPGNEQLMELELRQESQKGLASKNT